MRTVDLIHRKRDGEELFPEEISYLIDAYTRGEIPDYQMSAFLMAVFFAGMTDREVTTLTECMIRSGETVDLSSINGVKVEGEWALQYFDQAIAYELQHAPAPAQ